MHLPTVSLLVLFLPLIVTSADNLSCSQACEEALSYLSFNGTDSTADYYVAQCGNTLRVFSIFVCIRHYCSPRSIRAGLKDFNNTCEKYGGLSLPPYSIIDETSDEDAQGWSLISTANYTSTEVLDAAIFVSTDLYEIAKSTLDVWNYSETTRADYGYAMFGFWAIVLLVGSFSRGLRILQPLLGRRLARYTNTSHNTYFARARLWISYRLIIPAFGSSRTAEPIGWCTVPPRLQSLTIATFVIINIVLCCVSYRLFDGNLYWTDKSAQLFRYLADRAGVLAIANFPLLWTFGMRNNILLWLTGWSYSTFNIFHRWAARVATVEAVLHSISYTVEAFLEGGKAEYYADWLERYWWCGVVSCTAMCFVCAFSVYPMRKYLYEVFLMIHIALAVLLMVTLWFHIEVMDGEYNAYFWPCIAVWVFDRVVRIGRLAFFNLPLRSNTISCNLETNIIRLNFPKPQLLQPRPGTYYYIYILHGLKFWESHPFTLSSWTEEELYLTESDTKDRTTSRGSLSFIIRPHDSFTKRLRESVMRQTAKGSGPDAVSTSLRVLIEGPYGHHLDLKQYSSLLFLVGGTGITVALSQLCNIYYAVRRSQPIKLCSIRLVWAVRDIALFKDVYERELQQWLASPQLHDKVAFEIEVYVTAGPTFPGDETVANSSGSSSPTAKEIGIITNHELSSTDQNGYIETKIFQRRPHIASVVSQVIRKHVSDSDGGRMAVVSCGPARMADDARSAVVMMLGEGYECLDFYPESFTW